MRVATIGYEGDTIANFLKRLTRARIRMVVDIREIPLSRKPGFSKNKLAHALSTVGIEYVHFKSLGSPSSLRKKMRKDKDYKYFFKEYRKYMRGQKSTIRKVIGIVRAKHSALLCFEKNAEHCHRRAVVEELEKISRKNLSAVHL